ncbi:MAG: ABC transporter ATP-binding protein [Victivallales bacterium]|nr:ABC transporter ATP-binding protein [Victivallales bacterium]
MEKDILKVVDLRVSFEHEGELHPAVRNIGFTIRPKEMLALVGESGSGKSITALAIAGLLPTMAVQEAGYIFFDERELTALGEDEYNAIRGKSITMIFQEPMTSLNPVLKIKTQLEEVIRRHEPDTNAYQRSLKLLEDAGIADPVRCLDDYPHRLSGGMRQRVMIAMALACHPKLIIADEPTTALDVTTQARIMEKLTLLRQEYGTAVLLVTHNLALVRRMADRIAVMYAGEIVEIAEREELFANPRHPYTRLLLASVPSVSGRGKCLASIKGSVPAPYEEYEGCRFAPRCPIAEESCRNGQAPVLAEAGAGHLVACGRCNEALPEMCEEEQLPQPSTDCILRVSDLKAYVPLKQGLFGGKERKYLLEGINLELHRGETLAIVGESGSGKTTLGRCLARLFPNMEGSVQDAQGNELLAMAKEDFRQFRRKLQMIFQDPFSSLDPRMSVGEIICEGMEQFGLHANDKEVRLKELLEMVGLPEESATRYPHQFSGGQRQRIGIARALAVEPEIIICDEVTSALDVSVQAQILNLLNTLKRNLGLSYIFITHDLGVVSYVADSIAVMQNGRIVETGSAQDILDNPQQPYTKTLIAASPRL